MEESAILAKTRRANTIYLAIIVILAVLFAHSMARRSGEKSSWESALKSQQDSVKIWKNNSGKWQASAYQGAAEKSIILKVHGSELADLRKDITGLKKNMSNLQSVTSVALTHVGEIKTGVHDTLIVNNNVYDTAKTFKYSDRWAKINGFVLKDTAILKYKFYDSLSIVNYRKKKGIHIFRPDEMQIDVISHNPNTSISGLTSYRVKPKEKTRFVLGPFAGVDFRGKLTIGFGVTYKIIQF